MINNNNNNNNNDNNNKHYKNNHSNNYNKSDGYIDYDYIENDAYTYNGNT